MIDLPTAEKSLWRESYLTSLYPELVEGIQVDVVIVGAGITGLTSAYFLKQAGFKVAVLDKSTVGGGTTGRTTGKVTSQHNLIYEDLRSRLGPETARVYGEANQVAIEQVEKIINNQKIDCDWRRDDNYVFTDDTSKIAKFKREAEVAQGLGLPASFETHAPLPFDIKAAVKFTNQAKINSQKYLLGLASAVNGNGSFVFENSNVTGIKDGTPASVKTNKAAVTCKQIIVATNVPTFPLMARGGYCLLEYPTESYIIAAPLRDEVKGMYISPDKQHYSILPVKDQGRSILLIGGRAHLSGLRLSKKTRHQDLANYAERYFGVTTITHRWSDRDYLAYDDVPLIGKLYPWSKHVYVGTAFRKWGLSGGTVAAMILSDLLSGQDNKWASTFNSNRLKPITSIPRAVAKYLSSSG